MKLFILALCIVSAAAMGKKCKSADDCGEGECCVNFALVPFFGGRCRQLRKEGESCTPLIKDNDEVPNMYHFQCPCTNKEDLLCISTHQFKIGELIIKHKPTCVLVGNRTVIEEEITEDYRWKTTEHEIIEEEIIEEYGWKTTEGEIIEEEIIEEYGWGK